MTTLQKIRTLTLAAFLCLFPTCRLLLAEQLAYQDAASKCDHEIQVILAKVSDDYAHELNALMDTFRLRGDLEKTLAVKKEKERFESEKTLEERHLVKVPAQLRELQQEFLVAPRKAAEEIAKSYVVKLDDAKRKLTIDGRFDDALTVKQEIDKILKKYGIVNPAKGSDIQTEDLPKYIAMSRDVKIPTVVDGQQVGYSGLSKGDAYKLVKVQVTIRVANSDVVVPAEDTDLLQRIERKQKEPSREEQKEPSKEDLEENAAPKQVPMSTISQQAATAIVGTWSGGAGEDWKFDFYTNRTARIMQISTRHESVCTWSVDGGSVVVRWPNGCLDKLGPPIDPSATPGVNCKGVRYSVSKGTRN
jgi:hypothetical protein